MPNKYRCKIPLHLRRAGWQEITTPFRPCETRTLQNVIDTQKRAGYDTMIMERIYTAYHRGDQPKYVKYIHLLIRPTPGVTPARIAAKPAPLPAKPVIAPDPYQKRGTVKIGRYGQLVSTAGTNAGAHIQRMATDEQGYYSGR